MKRFLAGLGLGLAAGLVAGVAASQGLLGSAEPSPSRRSAPPRSESASLPPEAEAEQAPDAIDAHAAPPAAPPRGRVTRPAPVTRKAPEDTPTPDAPPPPPPTADEMIALVRRALAGEVTFATIRADAKRFVDAGAGNDVPVSFVDEVLVGVTDVETDRGYVATALATHVGGDEAVDALLAALRGDAPETRRLLLVAYQLSIRSTTTERDELTTLAEGLMAQPESWSRWAGMIVAGVLEPPPVAALERVANSDPDPELRDEARSLLLYSDDPAARAAVAPLLTGSALSGTLEERRDAVWMLGDLGSEGGDAALALLREGGLDWDERETLVHVLLGAGRVQELFAIAPGGETAEHVASWVAYEDIPDQTFEALMPHALEIIDAGDEDSGHEFLWEAANRGRFDLVESIATREATDSATRRYAVSTLLEGSGPLAQDGSEDEAGVSRAAQERGAALLRLLLRPETRASQRRAFIEDLRENGYEFADPATRTHVEITLRRTAAGDANSWVRLAAAEALAEMLDTEE